MLTDELLISLLIRSVLHPVLQILLRCSRQGGHLFLEQRLHLFFEGGIGGVRRVEVGKGVEVEGGQRGLERLLVVGGGIRLLLLLVCGIVIRRGIFHFHVVRHGDVLQRI